MADLDSTEQAQIIRQRLLAAKYGTPVFAPVVTSWLVRMLYPHVEQHLPDIYKRGQQDADGTPPQTNSDEVKSGKALAKEIFLGTFHDENGAKRLENIATDLLNYLIIGGTNHVVTYLRKRELVESFEDIVGDELGKPPEEVTWRDLGKSEHILVKAEFRKTQRSIFFGRMADLPFLVGAAIPLLKDFGIFKAWREKRDQAVDGLYNVLGQDAEAFAQRMKEREEQRTAGEDDLSVLNGSGHGTPIALISNAGYLVWEALGDYNTGNIQIQRLLSDASKKNGQINSTTLLDIYESYYKEFKRLYPKTIEDAEANRLQAGNEEKEPRKDVLYRVGQVINAPFKAFGAVKRLFRKEPESDRVIVPLAIRNLDPYTRGVFDYMAECMERSIDGRQERQWKNLRFTPDVFFKALEWVDPDEPKALEYVVRITSQTGLDGFKLIENHLATISKERGHAIKGAELTAELRKINTEVIRHQLAEVPSIAESITLQVQQDNGKVEQFRLNTVLVGELIGVNRLEKYFLELSGGHHEHAQSVSGRSAVDVVRISDNRFNELIEKIQARISQESGERFLLLDPLNKPNDARKLEHFYENFLQTLDGKAVYRNGMSQYNALADAQARLGKTQQPASMTTGDTQMGVATYEEAMRQQHYEQQMEAMRREMDMWRQAMQEQNERIGALQARDERLVTMLTKLAQSEGLTPEQQEEISRDLTELTGSSKVQQHWVEANPGALRTDQ